MTLPLREVLLFGLVGGAGFLVDSAVLYLVKEALGLYLGRVLSFLCAASFTWLVNRRLTFARRRSRVPAHREAAAWLMLMLGGGGVNYAVYALMVSQIEVVAAAPVLGVAAGSLAGMLVNYTLARSMLFRHSA